MGNKDKDKPEEVSPAEANRRFDVLLEAMADGPDALSQERREAKRQSSPKATSED